MPIPQFKPSKPIKTRPALPSQHWRNRDIRQKKKISLGWLAWLKSASFIKIVLLIIAIGFGIFVLMIVFFSFTLPSPSKLMERQVAESTKIYDREGKTIIYEIHGDQKRTLVTLDQIPKQVQQATIAIEDKDFYKHGAFSPWAIFRTAVTNVLFGKKAGGSTLTQQFVKNAVLTNEKKYTRKIKELILAYRLENKFSKDEILQMYLNEIPYGSSAYGVESASQYYFGKSITETNLAEAAILAALPQSPSRYSPYGEGKETLMKRQQYILDQMAKQGYITNDEAEAAKKVEIKFQARSENMMAPHFVMYIKQILEDKYGIKEVEQGGLKIYTTLDIKKQEIAEVAVKEQALKNEKSYNAKNAALVALDPKTGEVLAMVGSRDYFDDSVDGQVNVTLAPRQPGSSFKPIVYATAFLKGFTPDTMVYDVVTNFSTDGGKKYEPHNYDGGERGPISFRAALAGSLNIPAVKAMYLAGIDNVLKLAKDMGYSTLNDKDRFGLSLVLGGGEVKLLEHANAFSVFATEGELPEIVTIRKIEDRTGKVLEEFKEPKKKKVLEPNIAKMINSILSDNGARSYVFGASNRLTLGNRPVAAKTGTTNDYRDAWTIGYTPSLVAGVWVGNNDNSEMKTGADGSVVAAPIWNRFMRESLADSPIENFNGYSIDPKTPGILLGQGFGQQKIKIDKASGLLANDNTPQTFIVEKSYLQPHSILYFVDKNNPMGDAPKNPENDPQFNLWEGAVRSWIDRQKTKDPNFSAEEPPKDYDNIHDSGLKPSFSVIGLSDGITINEALPNITINASAPRGVSRVEYLINDKIFAASYSYPFPLNRALNLIPNGSQKLTIKVCDDIDNCASQDFTINLNLSQTFANDFSISWLSPGKNAELPEEAMPLTLKVALSSPDSIAELRFYLQQAGRETVLLQSKKMIRSSSEQIFWQPDVFIAGDYEFWVEASSWSGKTKETPKVKITLK